MYEVRESQIHGKGCFATKSIKSGQKIGEMKGVPVDENGPHVLWLDDETYEITCDLRYLNHSDTPNTELYNFEVLADRDIEKGEELTFDYGEEFANWIKEGR